MPSHKCSKCHYQGRRDLVKVDVDLSNISKEEWKSIKKQAKLLDMSVEKLLRHAIHNITLNLGEEA